MLNRVKNKNRQPSGLTETFLHFRGALERLVRKIVRQDEVEDIIAETYLRTFEHFGDAEIAYPKAFLYKTARNLALTHISRHENRFTQSIEDFPGIDVYLASEELENQIEAQEKFHLFCTAVESMSPKCSRAFVLKRVHGWSIKDIAKEMNISASTVEKHIAKGLLLCANSLEKNGYDLLGVVSKTDGQNLIKKS